MVTAIRKDGDSRFYSPEHAVTYLMPLVIESLVKSAEDPTYPGLPGWKDRVDTEAGQAAFMRSVFLSVKLMKTMAEHEIGLPVLDLWESGQIPVDDRGFKLFCEGLGRFFLIHYFVAAQELCPSTESEPLANQHITARVLKKVEQHLAAFSEKQTEAKYGKAQDSGGTGIDLRKSAT